MADLGYFLQAFNPMDFIKGYEQSKRTFLEGELKEAQNRQQKTAAELGEIGLGEYKSPQFTETRRLEDALKQATASLGGEQRRLELEAITDPETRAATLRALKLQPQIAEQRGILGLGRATFDVETQGQRQRIERGRLAGEEKRLEDEQKLKRLELDNQIASAVTKAFGNEATALTRDIDAEIERLQQLYPGETRDQILERAAAAFTDPRSSAIIREKQKNEAVIQAIQHKNAPASPAFKAAISRLMPRIRLGSPKDGVIPIYEVVGRDESGAEQLDVVGHIKDSEDAIEDFIYTSAGRLRPERERYRPPAQRAAPPAGSNVPAGVAAAVGGRRGAAGAQTTEKQPAGGARDESRAASSPAGRQTIAAAIDRAVAMGAKIQRGAGIEQALEAARQRAEQLATAESAMAAKRSPAAGELDVSAIMQPSAEETAVSQLSSEARRIVKVLEEAARQKRLDEEMRAESQRAGNVQNMTAEDIDVLLRRAGVLR